MKHQVETYDFQLYRSAFFSEMLSLPNIDSDDYGDQNDAILREKLHRILVIKFSKRSREDRLFRTNN